MLVCDSRHIRYQKWKVHSHPDGDDGATADALAYVAPSDQISAIAYTALSGDRATTSFSIVRPSVEKHPPIDIAAGPGILVAGRLKAFH
jgi:hypothetical protein